MINSEYFDKIKVDFVYPKTFGEIWPTIPVYQIDSSTIDGNVEFVRSQYICFLTSQVSIHVMCPTKLLIIVIILE